MKKQLPLYTDKQKYSDPTLLVTPSYSQVTATAYIETYGCQMNISDSELMAGILSNIGYQMVDNAETADVILINTCAIRENAEEKVGTSSANLLSQCLHALPKGPQLPYLPEVQNNAGKVQ